MNERCLDAETQRELYNVIKFALSPKPEYIFKFITGLGGVLNNVDECEVDEVGTDIIMYCVSNTEQCAPKVMLVNL